MAVRDSRLMQSGVVTVGGLRGNVPTAATSPANRGDGDRGGMTSLGLTATTRPRVLTAATGHGSLRSKVSASPIRWVPPANGKHSVTVAASNGSGTLMPSVGEQHPVIAFLRNHGLASYGELFVQNGFDDLDTLFDIEERDLQALGIPNGHAMKLLDAIQIASGKFNGQGVGSGLPFDEHNPVVLFLKDIGLAQYAEALLRNGFDELEILFHIEDADMKDMGIPRGHALKLRKRMQQYQADGGAIETYPESMNKQTMRSSAVATKPSLAAFSPPTELMKTAVVRSWEKVQKVGTEVVAEGLCRSFFALVPEALKLFPPEVLQKYNDWTAEEGTYEDAKECAAMRKLWGKVVNVVGCSVAGLHDINRLVPMLRQLGMRHINYGPTEEYWEIAGKALNITLQQIVGEDFTPEVEQAWTMTYAFITAVMVSGLREAQAAAAQASADLHSAQLNDNSSVHSSGATRVPSISDSCREDAMPNLPSLQTRSSEGDATQNERAAPGGEVHSRSAMPRPLPFEPNRWGSTDVADKQ